MIYRKPAIKKAPPKKPVLGPPAPRRNYTGKGPGSSYVSPVAPPESAGKKGIPFNKSPLYVPKPKAAVPNRTPPDRMAAPVAPAAKKLAPHPAHPQVGAPSAAPPSVGDDPAGEPSVGAGATPVAFPPDDGGAALGAPTCG